jgi:hypothetical protein
MAMGTCPWNGHAHADEVGGNQHSYKLLLSIQLPFLHQVKHRMLQLLNWHGM